MNGDEQPGENPSESAEQPDEVVRNDKVGTRFELAARIRRVATPGKANAGDEVDERESGEHPDESQERRSEKRTDRGRWNEEDSDVPSFERGAKPTRAGLLQATARK